MSALSKAEPSLALDGFNALRMCKTGPLLYNRHDIYVGGSIEKYGEFSVGEQDLFASLVRAGQLVVEVGANIGAHTVQLSQLVGSDGEIYAFEPQRIVFQALCANLALNQCANVKAWQAAVGSHSGMITVPAIDPSKRANFGGVSVYGVQEGEPVQLVPLDAFDLPACHFLKVDVEGMEVDVVKGAQKTIDMYRPLMYLENDRGERSQELLSLIFGLDYAAYWHLPLLFNPDNFDGNREDIFPGIVSVNVLCVPNEAKADLAGMQRIVSTDETWRPLYDRTIRPLLLARGYPMPEA